MKYKLVARHIKDQEADHAIDMARWGFSHRKIAGEVYGTDKQGHVSDRQVRRIGTILYGWGIKVKDYRNGQNKEGKAVLAAVRCDTNLLDAVREAGKEQLRILKSA